MSAFDSLKKFIGIEEVEEEGPSEEEVQKAKEKIIRENTRENSYVRKTPIDYSAKPGEGSTFSLYLPREICQHC